ncbi:MAG: C40 family peptidase, partial [Chloroflexi bacterium]|nr:C40 family peptidase [Chloroflexota bacterium]
GGDTAKESADLYEADKSKGQPPAGAFVFYDCSGTIGDRVENWGHVGLCVGQGEVIHAWGEVRIDDYLAIEDLGAAPGWSSPKYIGWAPLERILIGSVPKAY